MVEQIICDDNLLALKKIPDELIDLVYGDPPYYSGRNWDKNGHSFKDTWKDIEEYLSHMEARIREIHRILKSTGSFYLHIDTSASHYLKVLCDKIFGYNNFRNEIIWCYSGPSVCKVKLPSKHDVILFYSKSKNYNFNPIRIPYQKGLTVGGKTSWSGQKADTTEYLKKGKLLEDWWNDIPALQRNEKEKRGYPTQKPIKLLKRIITMSSNENDIVLDPYCGSGTTLEAARDLKRQYIGIDNSASAIELCKERLKE
jgi:site-specific DNA-methyltransferase (adenine-specific)